MFDATVASGEIHPDVARVLGAVEITGPSRILVGAGPAINIAPQPAPWNAAAGAGGDQALTRAIADALYGRCYMHRLEDGPQVAFPAAHTGEDAFTMALAAANAGRDRWDGGWVIQQPGPNGQMFVRKGERERIAIPGAFISAITPGMAPQLGSTVQLRAPAGAAGLQPGYYFAFGETLEELAEQVSLVRFYFHCLADGAVPLLRALTLALNRFQIPFQMKLPCAPALYGRADAVVLYVGARYVPITRRLVAIARDALALSPSVPLFAKPLWPGIAGAVDPGTGESFGVHRCRLTAEGIVDAWRVGRQDVAARWDAVCARFAAAGLDAARPWVGTGGADPFPEEHA